MAASLSVVPVVRFHLSLNVQDLGRSVAFYRALFGVEPAKQRPDYAKFELTDPPVVLSLEPAPHSGGGALNHVGFRMPEAAALVAMQQGLGTAGIATQREEGVECCYARQTKFWAHDPDGTLWETEHGPRACIGIANAAGLRGGAREPLLGGGQVAATHEGVRPALADIGRVRVRRTGGRDRESCEQAVSAREAIE